MCVYACSCDGERESQYVHTLSDKPAKQKFDKLGILLFFPWFSLYFVFIIFLLVFLNSLGRGQVNLPAHSWQTQRWPHGTRTCVLLFTMHTEHSVPISSFLDTMLPPVFEICRHKLMQNMHMHTPSEDVDLYMSYIMLYLERFGSG